MLGNISGLNQLYLMRTRAALREQKPGPFATRQGGSEHNGRTHE